MDAAAAGELDRISALPDDLLHVILGFLRYAPAVTRTAVLSRRWRHVWTGVKSLEFQDYDMRLRMYNSQLVRFVDWVLAQRGDADMVSLKIHFWKTVSCDSPEKVNEWLRYAARHVVKSVLVDVVLGQRTGKQGEQQIIEMPSHGRAESISLVIPDHKLQVRDVIAARYEALTELQLVYLWFDEDGGWLSDFVASSRSCPRLRRLHIVGPRGLRWLVLRSKVLEEFIIRSAIRLQTLDMATPSLRVINISHCFTDRNRDRGSGGEYVKGTNKLARIVAPKLKEIVNMNGGDFRIKPTDLEIYDLTSVRCLSKIHLHYHGKYHSDRDNLGFWLLERCPSVEHIDVWLSHEPREKLAMDEQLVDPLGKAPLPRITSVTVRAFNFMAPRHFMPSMYALLVRCPHVTSLNVELYSSVRDEAHERCFCDEVADKWEIHGKVALESLEEVKINRIDGVEEEMQLVRFLFQSSSSIKRMALAHAYKPVRVRLGVRSRKTIYHELMKIPCVDQGRWLLSEKATTWTRCT